MARNRNRSWKYGDPINRETKRILISREEKEYILFKNVKRYFYFIFWEITAKCTFIEFLYYMTTREYPSRISVHCYTNK